MILSREEASKCAPNAVEIKLTYKIIISTKIKNKLRTSEAQIVQKCKNSEARPKFTGSYFKKVYSTGGWEGGGVAAWKGRSSNICIRRCSRTIEATSSSKGNGLLFLACLYRVIDAIGKL